MKNTFLLIILACTTYMAIGQGDPIRHFYNKHKSVANATHINIGGILLDIATKYTDEEESKALLARINRLRILTVPNESKAISDSELLSLRQSVLSDDFEELVMVRNKGSFVNVYMQEDEQDIIRQVLILVEDKEEVTMVSLLGKMRYEDLKHIDLGGEAGEALELVEVP